jgi:hypothetical protein
VALPLVGCVPGLEPLPPPPASASKEETTASQLAAEGFAALGQREGVTIYRRDKLAGFEFAAEGDFPAEPSRVREVILDYPAHKSWQDHLGECRVLGQGPDWMDVYERLDLPLLEDRDYTLHVTWGDEEGVLWTRFVTANDHGPPEVKDVVRVTSHEGGWRLVPATGGTATHALYRFHLDLQSGLTQSMGKGQAASDLVDLFTHIRQQLPKYPAHASKTPGESD